MSKTNIDEINRNIYDVKNFIEIMYERWIKTEMHYLFTVETNKRFDKFQLPYKLSAGIVIERNYKTTEIVTEILDYRMFERKIAYSEEMIWISGSSSQAVERMKMPPSSNLRSGKPLKKRASPSRATIRRSTPAAAYRPAASRMRKHCGASNALSFPNMPLR